MSQQFTLQRNDLGALINSKQPKIIVLLNNLPLKFCAEIGF